jgi:hypothetical protein
LLFGLAGLFRLVEPNPECLSDRLAAHALEFAKALIFCCPGFGSSPFARAVLQLLLATTAKLGKNATTHCGAVIKMPTKNRDGHAWTKLLLGIAVGRSCSPIRERSPCGTATFRRKHLRLVAVVHH